MFLPVAVLNEFNFLMIKKQTHKEHRALILILQI